MSTAECPVPLDLKTFYNIKAYNICWLVVGEVHAMNLKTVCFPVAIAFQVVNAANPPTYRCVLQ